MTGGFGDIYYGDCIIKDGEHFEGFGRVVAKKTRRPSNASDNDVSPNPKLIAHY